MNLFILDMYPPEVSYTFLNEHNRGRLRLFKEGVMLRGYVFADIEREDDVCVCKLFFTRVADEFFLQEKQGKRKHGLHGCMTCMA